MFTWSFWCSKQHLRSGGPLANLTKGRSNYYHLWSWIFHTHTVLNHTKPKKGTNTHTEPAPTSPTTQQFCGIRRQVMIEQAQNLNYIYFLEIISGAQRSFTAVQDRDILHFLSIFCLDVKRVTVFKQQIKHLWPHFKTVHIPFYLLVYKLMSKWPDQPTKKNNIRNWYICSTLIPPPDRALPLVCNKQGRVWIGETTRTAQKGYYSSRNLELLPWKSGESTTKKRYFRLYHLLLFYLMTDWKLSICKSFFFLLHIISNLSFLQTSS